jgi:hypothetical protein
MRLVANGSAVATGGRSMPARTLLRLNANRSPLMFHKVHDRAHQLFLGPAQFLQHGDMIGVVNTRGRGSANPIERRPTLTAPARAGLHDVWVGAKKRDSKSNKETGMKEEGSRECVK